MTGAFVTAALYSLGLDLYQDRTARSIEARFVTTVRGMKGGDACLYEYDVSGDTYQITENCRNRPTVTVDYLPNHPTIARTADRRGVGRANATFFALFALGSFIAVLESLRERARTRALGPNFSSEGALPEKPR